jgi:hypothetical protein
VFRLGIAIVRGRSMLPTLSEGDRLLVAYGARPRPGRLVLCDLPPDADGSPRPVSVKRLTGAAEHLGLPGPGWWVERDNPAEGVDSWLVGALPPAAIRAVVLGRLPRGIRWGRERE